MTTLDQMAKAAYEAVADRLARRGALWEPWENLPERIHEDWRAAIRAALASVPPNAAASLSYESKPEPAEVKPEPAEVKPDAVTG